LTFSGYSRDDCLRTAEIVNRKAVKNVHLSVHPPTGRATLVAPDATRLEIARAYAISKPGWICEQQS
jgi:predicted metal-dependent hydrolase